MKKLYFLAILAFPLMSIAQSSNPTSTYDSVKYYQKQIFKLWHNTSDSLKKTEQYKALEEQIKKLRKDGNYYSGLVLYTDIIHTDFSKFNQSIAQDGFSPMNSMSVRFGIGVSSKNERTMFDFYVVTFGINNKSSNRQENIKSSLSNFCQIDLGYDLLKSKTVSLYPFAGLSLRSSVLNFSKPIQTNSSYTNISNIVTNDQTVNSSTFKVGYQVGIGLDVAISKAKDGMSKTILFSKFGTNSPIGSEKYSIDDVSYNPDIKHGDWLFTVGFKFVSTK